MRKHFGVARLAVGARGQWLGAMARAIVLPGERGRAARKRAALYRLGPVRVEARYRGGIRRPTAPVRTRHPPSGRVA